MFADLLGKLNCLVSYTRFHAAFLAVAVIPSPLCGGLDTVEHILSCPTRAASSLATASYKQVSLKNELVQGTQALEDRKLRSWG